jgi:hypothetical protein
MLLQFSLATVPILPIGASINSVKTQDSFDLRVIILSFLSEKQRTSVDQSQAAAVLEKQMKENILGLVWMLSNLFQSMCIGVDWGGI